MLTEPIDIADLAYPLVHTDPADIREYELEPAIGDALPVTFIYDHPERGHELRRAVPESIERGRHGWYVLCRDLGRDAYRSFRLNRIIKAKMEEG